jgi:hypothetical protein
VCHGGVVADTLDPQVPSANVANKPLSITTRGDTSDITIETTGVGSALFIRSDAGSMALLGNTSGLIRSGDGLSLQSTTADISLASATGTSIDLGAVSTNPATTFGMIRTPFLAATQVGDYTVTAANAGEYIPWGALELGVGYTLTLGAADGYITIIEPGLYLVTHQVTFSQGWPQRTRTAWIEFSANFHGSVSTYANGVTTGSGSAVLAVSAPNMVFRLGVSWDGNDTTDPIRLVQDARITATRIGAFVGQDPPQVQL